MKDIITTKNRDGSLSLVTLYIFYGYQFASSQLGLASDVTFFPAGAHGAGFEMGRLVPSPLVPCTRSPYHHRSYKTTTILVMHRLGGAGLAALQRQQESLRSFDALSNQISTAQVESLHAQVEQFSAALTHFATHHRADIRRDPRLRHAFQQMCASIGVDPLAGPRRGGWWEEALGLGDWQSELGVQIVDVCVSSRERNGGIIELSELVRILSRLRGLEGGGGGAIMEEDVVRSIQALKVLGTGYEVLEFGSEGGGRRMVRSVPKELDADQMVVLALAAEQRGRVDEELLVRRNAWTAERARAVLQNMLLRDGTCWLDEQDGPDGMGRAYWIPAAMQWDD
jgi:ESCRT-II complex subunit VPS22